mmetsp:Transcript_11027/g.26772  ORF Transcript_11027/g.26772 Transcript_11027/m.26772 type:complete len:225 (-) Transcript_11027:1079-1753(-)
MLAHLGDAAPRFAPLIALHTHVARPRPASPLPGNRRSAHAQGEGFGSPRGPTLGDFFGPTHNVTCADQRRRQPEEAMEGAVRYDGGVDGADGVVGVVSIGAAVDAQPLVALEPRVRVVEAVSNRSRGFSGVGPSTGSIPRHTNLDVDGARHVGKEACADAGLLRIAPVVRRVVGALAHACLALREVLCVLIALPRANVFARKSLPTPVIGPARGGQVFAAVDDV